MTLAEAVKKLEYGLAWRYWDDPTRNAIRTVLAEVEQLRGLECDCESENLGSMDPDIMSSQCVRALQEEIKRLKTKLVEANSLATENRGLRTEVKRLEARIKQRDAGDEWSFR